MAGSKRIRLDLVGQTFNRLFVLEEAFAVWSGNGRDKNGVQRISRTRMWRCRCDCGEVVVVRQSDLRMSKTKSCGYHGGGKGGKSYAHSTHPLFTTFYNMVSRCFNPNNNHYHRYGGRGITICERWRNNFEAFVEDMGPKPTTNHSIERVNNDGNYDPQNCIWGTEFDQQNNRITNHLVTYQGRTQTLAQWCQDLRLKYGTIQRRLNKLKWPIDKAFETPAKIGQKMHFEHTT